MTAASTNANACAGPSDHLDDPGPFDEAGLFDENEEFGDKYDDDLGEPVETIDELGRRHVRRAAPYGTEQIIENEAPRTTGLPDKLERWRQRTATGTVLTAFAFGLQQVFEPERKEPAIIMQTSGDPPKDLPVQAQLEQLGPRQSSVTVRPWLLGNNEQARDAADGAPDLAAPEELAGPGADDVASRAITGDEAGTQ